MVCVLLDLPGLLSARFLYICLRQNIVFISSQITFYDCIYLKILEGKRESEGGHAADISKYTGGSNFGFFFNSVFA